jgi:hypothetical protein
MQVAVVPEATGADEGHQVRRIRVSRRGFDKMIGYIAGGVARDAGGRPVVSALKAPWDVFYDTVDGYSVRHNCNDWVLGALSASGAEDPE